ncbi:MAG: hypothetical protein AAF762_10195 [Pseudomonadota bacterium]
MRLKAILLLFATVAFVTAPIWSSGFGGFNADQFPIPQEDPPVTPAGYAFSIWGVIYVWLLLSAIYGFARSEVDPSWDAMRLPLIASMAFGAPWISVAQVSPVLASVLIWLMLVTALVAMFRAPRAKPWLAAYSVQLYAGWLTAASCVSIALLGAGWGVGPEAEVWALIALTIATVIALTVLSRLAAPAYAVAVVWALVAVVVRNWGQTDTVAYAAVAGAVVIAVAGVFSATRGRAAHA